MVPCKVDYALVDSKGSNRTRNLIYLMSRFVSLETWLSANMMIWELCIPNKLGTNTTPQSGMGSGKSSYS